jgi:hypothetical protein
MRNTSDVTGGKLIAVRPQSISGVRLRTINMQLRNLTLLDRSFNFLWQIVQCSSLSLHSVRQVKTIHAVCVCKVCVRVGARGKISVYPNCMYVVPVKSVYAPNTFIVFAINEWPKTIANPIILFEKQFNHSK